MTYRAHVISTERRSAPTSWDLMKLGPEFGVASAGIPVSANLAENLSVVFACVQVLAETTAALPALVYQRLAGGGRAAVGPDHSLARLFGGDANARQTMGEFVEQQTAHMLLRGNSYAEILRNTAGQAIALEPYHPDAVSVLRLPSGRIRYDVSLESGPVRRLLPEEVLHLRDRSDDGIVGKSRLRRAREAFGSALAVERFASATFRNGAQLSGVLTHPQRLNQEAKDNIRASFESLYKGAERAGEIGIFEEGMRWQQISVSPEDAQMLESRRFGVESLARIFRVPPPVIGHMDGANYAALAELGRWFVQHSIVPLVRKWEGALERSLLSAAARATHEIEFDCDELLRGDMLTRFQAYRIAREIGVYNANELRRFEHANPRTDDRAEVYFEPLNMQPEQTGQPRDDR